MILGKKEINKGYPSIEIDKVNRREINEILYDEAPMF